jgi:hypothetical protein
VAKTEFDGFLRCQLNGVVPYLVVRHLVLKIGGEAEFFPPSCFF